MATETGIIKSITSSYAEITDDVSGATIESKSTVSNLVVDDGVEYDVDAGKATNILDITKVSIKGDLTQEERNCVKSLVKSLNARKGGGKIEIGIKTKK
jgi:hypothetical protein